ncbi:unnamed protein product, partial [Brenthis ino]
MKAVLFLCLLVTLVAAQDESGSCGPNEVFRYCGTCQTTCSNLNPICIFECGRPGCFCTSGYTKNSDGACIPISECP